MKRIISVIVIVLVIISVALRLKTNHEKINKAKPDSGISNVVNVNVVRVSEQETGHTLDLTGTLNPATELNIPSQAQGQIIFLNVELGQFITKGSTIAIIDNKLKQLAVRSAKISEEKLKRDLERYQNLYKGGTVTEQQLEEVQNAYESAKILLDQAEKQLADATVVAPFSGLITQKPVELGAFINPGSPVAGIVDISKLKIQINASEAHVYQIKTGDQAVVTTEVYPGTEFSGRITFVSDRGDDSHNYPVEVEIPNNNQNPLKAGTFVNVKIKVPGTARALFIPREALVGSTQDASVYIVESGKAVLRKITVMNTAGADLQVKSGLTKDETIIVTGQINLVDGKEINIVEN